MKEMPGARRHHAPAGVLSQPMVKLILFVFVDFGRVRVCRCTGWKDHVHIRDCVRSPRSLSGIHYSLHLSERSVRAADAGMACSPWNGNAARNVSAIGMPAFRMAVTGLLLRRMAVIEMVVYRV